MDYYSQIKEHLINNEIYKAYKDYSKNKNDLETYYNVGKLLIEAQGGEQRAKYGNRLIEEYSKKLLIDMDKKYSITLLKYMRQFYLLIQKGHAVRDQLSISHYREVFPIKDYNKIEFYLDLAIKQNLSYRALHDKIKNKEYERLDDRFCLIAKSK